MNKFLLCLLFAATAAGGILPFAAVIDAVTGDAIYVPGEIEDFPSP